MTGSADSNRADNTLKTQEAETLDLIGCSLSDAEAALFDDGSADDDKTLDSIEEEVVAEEDGSQNGKGAQTELEPAEPQTSMAPTAPAGMTTSERRRITGKASYTGSWPAGQTSMAPTAPAETSTAPAATTETAPRTILEEIFEVAGHEVGR